MQITDISTGKYRNQDLWPQTKTHTGTEDALDGCILNYTKEEVKEHLDIIIEDRGILAYEANSTIVKGAIFARFIILINRVSESLAANEDTHGKMGEWQGLLKRWLYDPELNKTNDAMVKHHVILALKNLKDGPFNETSEALFGAED